MSKTYQHRSTDELELIAEHFLSGQDAWYIDGVAVRIEEMLENQGYDIWPVRGLNPILAGYLPISGKRIFVDEVMQVTDMHAYRFTLAEEQAHELIHRPFFRGWSAQAINDFRESMSHAKYVAFEREVKLLSGLVMSLEADAYKETARLIQMLSDAFNVEPYAAEWRCHQLGLLEENLHWGVAS